MFLMATVHISEADAAKNLAGLLARVRAGDEVVIDGTDLPSVRLSGEPRGRLLSEALRLAREHGSTATLDDEFAKDMESAIALGRAPLSFTWD